MGDWGRGNEIGAVYVLNAECTARVGGGWMKGRLRAGDIALCIEHTGDGFFDYILLETGENFVKGIPASRFGSYCFGVGACRWLPSDREFHLLCAGESITIPISERTQHPLTAEVGGNSCGDVPVYRL